MATDSVSCWVVTDGKAGMESQCIGLAEALGLDPIVKCVALRAPWRQFTPHFRFAQSLGFAKQCDALKAPWPDLVIATGRQSVAASIFIRAKARKDGKRTITVQLQNPGLSSSYFDLVVAPRHDGLVGENVIATRGALHRITGERTSEGAARLTPYVSRLPRPYIGVLLGGSNAAYRFDADAAGKLGRQLAHAAQVMGGSLLVTASRRTGEVNENVFKDAIRMVPNFFWEGNGFNPYFGILGLADFLVVTCDSVNMVSEALASGKPVYVADLPGGARKFESFHRHMRDEGLTRPFDGVLEAYSYVPPKDMAEVTARIRALLHNP
ncbi:MAG: mitochondrial fission ELM1 family protein [Micropepsaceae bacterium]